VHYDPDAADHGLPRNPFKSLVVPRPIGWISSLSRAGVVNLAPYSFFNAVAEEPPMVMFAAGDRRDSNGALKDSRRNAEETGEFVVNIATSELREKMSATSASLPPEVDEMAAASLTPAPSVVVKPPRVKESPVNLECRWWKTIELPTTPPARSNAIVIGRVVRIHIAEEILTDGMVDMAKFHPIARLGYWQYTVVDNDFWMRPPP